MTPPRKLALPKPVQPLLMALEDAGFASYLVGGAVRDGYLGLPVSDFDIATSARPDDVKRIFSSVFDTGLKHGTVTVQLGQSRFEVTTFRHEGPYLDGRRPAYVHFASDIESDLARRDFTMNALAVGLDEVIVDPFDGLSDLDAKRLRAVGHAESRFREDGLRLLRALRFASVYEFEVEASTWTAMQACADAIARIAKERVGVELRKLSEGNWATQLPSLAASQIWRFAQGAISTLGPAFQSLQQKQNDISSSVAHPRGAAAFATWYACVTNGPEQVATLCREIALGRPFAAHAQSICQLVRQLTESTNGWSPRHLFGVEREDASVAIEIADWLGVDRNEALLDQARARISTQPIWNQKELRIDGGMVMANGISGRAVGEILRTLTEEVLGGTVANESPALLQRVSELTKGRPQVE